MTSTSAARLMLTASLSRSLNSAARSLTATFFAASASSTAVKAFLAAVSLVCRAGSKIKDWLGL
ncbi:MAG TPA: hypothetical protein VF599_18020 [Pyrinomonadaceae bacterium]